MSSTLEDIARKAGLSVSTVSRVLNNVAGKYRISSATEKLVLKAAGDLKYRPNQLARGLRLKKTQSIGLVIPDISNPFFAHVTRSIQTNAHRFGYSLVVCDTDENVDLEIEHIDLLVAKGVDGLILLPVGQQSDHLVRFEAEGIPFVLVDRCFDNVQANSVVVDNYRGAYDIVEYAIKQGHKRIGIIQGLPNTYTTKERLKGYKDALKKSRISLDPSLIVGDSFRQETGYVETKSLLELPDKPTVIFATGDLIALGVLEAVEELKLTIPDDISVIAFDEIDVNPFLKCPLTTVVQPKEDLGEAAVNLLLEVIKAKGKKIPKQIVINPSVQFGKSVLSLSNPVPQHAAVP